MLVSFDDFFQVVIIDGLLAGRILLLQTLLQNLGRGLQVDDEIGRGQLFAEKIVVTIVGFQFLVAEIQAGE